MEYKFVKYNFDNPSLLEIIENEIVLGLLSGIYHEPNIKRQMLKGNEKVLDFGCGNGMGSKYLAKKLNKGTLVCLDTSNYWLSKAKKRLKHYENVLFEQNSIFDAMIDNNSLDAVNISYVLHDIEPYMRKNTILKITEKLKDKGKLYIFEPTKYSHGIAVQEIYGHMKNAGLVLVNEEIMKNKYWGQFEKA